MKSNTEFLKKQILTPRTAHDTTPTNVLVFDPESYANGPPESPLHAPTNFSLIVQTFSLRTKFMICSSTFLNLSMQLSRLIARGSVNCKMFGTWFGY